MVLRSRRRIKGDMRLAAARFQPPEGRVAPRPYSRPPPRFGIIAGARTIWLIGPAMDLDVEAIKARLEALRSEHRDLDEAIARIADKAPFNQLQIQRLKKRKLVLKDLIIKLESQLVPDIIA